MADALVRQLPTSARFRRPDLVDLLVRVAGITLRIFVPVTRLLAVAVEQAAVIGARRARGMALGILTLLGRAPGQSLVLECFLSCLRGLGERLGAPNSPRPWAVRSTNLTGALSASSSWSRLGACAVSASAIICSSSARALRN